MSSVDDRIVAMKFNNGQFEQGVKTTLSSLSALKQGLKFDGATKGLAGVSDAVKGISLTTLASSIQDVSSKFSAMSVVAITALATIANKAVNAGLTLAKSLTIDPIKSGFSEYETKLGSVQTILANTQASGAKLSDVNLALEKLNEYSDQTIYNFGEMARNIGTFTAAGVNLETATGSIKGIANLAALSGSNSQQASTAMYQLSQAISSGKVSLMDWNSVVNAGMGGSVFQRALAETAVKMGTIDEGALKLTGDMKNVSINGQSFRDSLTAKDGTSWLNGDVLTKTLQQFTGDLSDADLAAQGFSASQIKAIQKQAQVAKDAATKVKTISQLMGTLRESVGSGWAQTWEIVFGGFEEAKTLFTSINNVLGGFIKSQADARNALLKTWSHAGGRALLIESLGDAFKALMSIIKPIKDAFTEIFPPVTAGQLLTLTRNLKSFTDTLKITTTTSKNIKKTFKGLFSILKIGWEIIKGLLRYFGDFLGLLSGGGGGILALTGNIGGLLTKLSEWILKGDRIANFFDSLIEARKKVMGPLIDFVERLSVALGLLFKGDISGFRTAFVGSFSALLPLLTNIKDAASNMFGELGGSFGKISDFVKELSSKITELFRGSSSGAGQAIKDIGAKALGPLQSFLTQLSAAFQKLRSIFDSGVDKFSDKLGGASDKLSIFEKITGKIKSLASSFMDTFRQLFDFAAPVVSWFKEYLSVLSQKIMNFTKEMNFEDLVALINTAFFIMMYKNITGFAKAGKGLIKDLSGVGKTFKEFKDGLSNILTESKPTVILKLAIAVGILAASVWVLSKIDPKALGISMAAITAMLVQLMLTLKVFNTVNTIKENAKIISTAFALILLGYAVGVLASAVVKLGGISWGELIKGLVGVGMLLGALALFTKFAKASENSIPTAAGLIILAVAIRLLVNSVSILGQMDSKALQQGIIALGFMIAALYVMVDAMNNTKGIFTAAVGLLILSAALLALSAALLAYSTIDFKTLIKGLEGMMAVLLGVALAMQLMPSDMPAMGVGLILVAVALTLLAGVLKLFSLLDATAIAKSLLVLVVALSAIAVTMILMTGTASGALALMLVAVALTMLAPALLALGSIPWKTLLIGLGALVVIMLVFVGVAYLLVPIAAPLMLLALAIREISIAMMIGSAAMMVFAVASAMLATTGTAAIAVLVAGFMGVLNLIPLMAQQIGLGFKAMMIVVAAGAKDFVNAMVKVLFAVMDGIDRVAPRFFDMATRLVLNFLKMIQRLSPQVSATGVQMILDFLRAVDSRITEITKSATSIIKKFIDQIAKDIPDIIESGVKLILAFIRGLEKAIREHADDLGDAGLDLADAIIDGMAGGIKAGAERVAKAARELASKALNAAKDFLSSHSPSKKFIELGMWSAKGLAIGLVDNADLAAKGAKVLGSKTLSAIKVAMTGVDDVIDSNMNLSPTITPVLDLESVTKDASMLNGMLGALVSVQMAYNRANDISASSGTTTQIDGTNGPSASNVTYIQNNTSPKALSSADIYRQTKNQLSVTKKGL